MNSVQFTPKLFTLLKTGIPRSQLLRDLIAGTVVGIVAFPLAVAFGIASGVSPEKGLITAIAAGLIISALGGSRVQIGGPTGAFIVIVYGVVQDYGVDGLILATFIAGFMIAGFGLFRLGNLIKFIPYPLIVGFTSAIALIIFTSQIKDFLGLPLEKVPADFLEKLILFSGFLGQINGYSLAIAGATVLLVFNFHRVSARVPGSMAALLLSTAAVTFLDLPVPTIGSIYGPISNQIAMPHLPPLNLELLREMMHPAFAIAILGAIESLLSAVVADGMIGGRHRSNVELMAQGGANIFSALLGGIPATGAIARTATNVKNGGRTPIAGITHALVLLLIFVFLAPYAAYIPMACLAGILVGVSWHMGEWHSFLSVLRQGGSEAIVLLSTFLLTLFVDLIIAIEIGIVLSSFIFVKRMSDATQIADAAALTGTGGKNEGPETLFEEELPDIPEGILLYEISGPLFFGASQKFQDVLLNLHQLPRIIILRMKNVPFIDSTGLYRLREMVKHLRSNGVEIMLSGVQPGVRPALTRSGVEDFIGKSRIHPQIADAIAAATQMIEP
ncbi:MAG: STAS domain-containing protein [Calditrichaeota bacterium]|nr:STAS domain-containing protein [Calditrichota bacterium]